MDAGKKRPPRKVNPRRTFSVKSQLVGKLGEDGYAALVEGLESAAQEPKRKRRRRPRRKPVAA
jgi:hypothetical protein